jgi:hypothetical protein
MRPDGKLFLVNENMLKPWQSQEKFMHRLLEDPIAMGHYGGNEHAYHNYEYCRMLRTQFSHVEMKVPRAGTAIDDLRNLLSRNVNGNPIYSSTRRVLPRFLFQIARAEVRKHPIWYRLLGRAGLLPVHFVAWDGPE